MGLNKYSGSSSVCSADTPSTGNPDPSNFKILRMVNYNTYTLVEVLYPDCKNFEGKKLLLFHAPNSEVEKAKIIDPHFCDGEHISLVARFRPDKEGWLNACRMACILMEQDLE